MTSRRYAERIRARIKRREKELAELEEFLDMMLSSDVNSYTVGSRNLSRYKNPTEVLDAMKRLEDEIDLLESELVNGARNKAFAIVPRDW